MAESTQVKLVGIIFQGFADLPFKLLRKSTSALFDVI